MISAAGSMMPVHETLRAGFAEEAPDVELHFLPPNHSGLLSQEILAGGAADVFISAGWRYVIELQEAGLLPQPEVIAGNRLALLVRPDVADEIRDVRDLARPGIRLFVPPEEFDPLAQYTAQLFARAGLSAAIQAKRERGETRERLSGLRDSLAAAGIDALVMYASMLETFSSAGKGVPLLPPYDMSDQIVFGAGAIERDGQAHPAAAQFVSFLIGSKGQARLLEAGFLPREHALPLISASPA